ncbi:ATP-binding protein [Allomesorhizobium camelthorni]|uniref:histidine kinase n=1 Tax=Allomesorhizobium camelthorni TaxID=475069 RepID=A0A6G4W9V5_9HYPH|nr:ATP-binding protein [Mesorhizobium camelthorni]NGO51118.1 response regulator [Mesorhizobium camelthorni]
MNAVAGWLKASAKNRTTWVLATGLTLVTLVLAFVLWQNKEREINVELLRTNAWVAWQVEKEYLRFLLAVDHFEHHGGDGELRDLMLRFEILYSRPTVALYGPESSLIRSVQGVPETFARLLSVLDEIEAKLNTLAPGDTEAAKQIRHALKPFESALTEVSMSASRGEVARQLNERLDKLQVTSTWLLISLVGTASALLTFLSFEAARSRRLAEWEGEQRRKVDEANRALQQSEARYRHLVESTGAVPYTLDLSLGMLDYIGPQAEKILSYTSEECRSCRDWNGYVVAEEAAKLSAARGRAAQDLVDAELEYRIAVAANNPIWVRDTMKTVCEAGGRVTGYGLLFDITGSKRQEQALATAQKMEAVGQLTGGVAHDFNNLLTIILGNADALAERLPSKGQLQPLAQLIKLAAKRGAELTNRLLAFSRRQTLDPNATDVIRLICGMDELLRRALGEHVEMAFVPGDGLWKALVDAAQLESAVLNLCLNARDAMPEGGRLTISTMNIHFDQEMGARYDDLVPGRYVMVAVSDTGTGMDEKTSAHAFEPFFTTKEVGRGSGLGLSMVYGFVKQSKGHVKIYSELGHGTTVRLYLPHAPGDADDLEKPDDSGSFAPKGSEKVLLVEDDDMVRNHAQDQLRSLGYHVVSVPSGSEALEVLKREDAFDLLFTDVVMRGGMSGPQLADEAKRLCPDLPVLFTSGYAEDTAFRDGSLDCGLQLLPKPYRKQDLAAKVRSILDDWQKRNLGRK